MSSVDAPVTSVMFSGGDCRGRREDKFIMTSVGALVSILVSNSPFTFGLPMCLAVSESFTFDLPICLDEPFFLIQLASFLDRL
jgi:hypothetical protein